MPAIQGASWLGYTKGLIVILEYYVYLMNFLEVPRKPYVN
jgi:hypothetical protein